MTTLRPRRFHWSSAMWGALILGGWLFIGNGLDHTPADPNSALVLNAPHRAEKPLPDQFQVVTWNIHGGKGTDRRLDLSRIAKLISPFDLAGLNEVRAQGTNQADELGQLTEAGSLFAPTEKQWYAPCFGNGLLSRTPISLVERIPLPNRRGKAFRHLLLVEAGVAPRTVRLLITHLDSQGDRLPQLALAFATFQSLRPPAIFMGDFNTSPHDLDLQSHISRLLKTIDATNVIDRLPLKDRPKDYIDWMLVSGLDVVSADYVPNEASDHPLIRAKLAWRNSGEIHRHDELLDRPAKLPNTPEFKMPEIVTDRPSE